MCKSHWDVFHAAAYRSHAARTTCFKGYTYKLKGDCYWKFFYTQDKARDDELYEEHLHVTSLGSKYILEASTCRRWALILARCVPYSLENVKLYLWSSNR